MRNLSRKSGESGGFSAFSSHFSWFSSDFFEFSSISGQFRCSSVGYDAAREAVGGFIIDALGQLHSLTAGNCSVDTMRRYLTVCTLSDVNDRSHHFDAV